MNPAQKPIVKFPIQIKEVAPLSSYTALDLQKYSPYIQKKKRLM
jgi:hypothetical protein